jgi:hypothetical protein
MTTMNMPGFTADTSLYKTSGRYQSVANQGYSSGEQSVISQIRGGGGIGVGGFGGLNAWGCWDSWCCTCEFHEICNPVCHWDCCEERCTRCIWPW